MKASAPLLAPILRSDTQGRLLAELYLNPEGARTTTELARIAGTSVPNASREISRMVRAGYLTSQVSGRNRYISVNRTHPLYAPLTEILNYSYGPLAILPQVLRDIPGISDAYIHGSWAARLAGEPGPDPHDIDVLIIGEHIDLERLDQVSEEARRLLGREINARTVSSEAWNRRDDVFLRHVSERPLVKIPIHESSP